MEVIAFDIILTTHARERMNQRGITLEMVEWALRIGQRIYARNSLYIFLGKRALRKLGKMAEKWEGLTLVLDPRSKTLLTCFKNRCWIKKIHHKK